MKLIDVNMDVGEGLGNEAKLFPFISSCNIACGGHFGNHNSMMETAKLAKDFELKIGVHPSFPDKIHFGRKRLNMSPLDLKVSLKIQIINFLEVLHNLKIELHHLKLHGALYNLAAKNLETASLIIEVLKELNLNCIIYAPYKSVFSELASLDGLEVWNEAFGDRSYNSDGSLVSRTETNAVLSSSKAMSSQVLQMLRDNRVSTRQDIDIDIKVDTICLHGDTPNAPFLAECLYNELVLNGYRVG